MIVGHEVYIDTAGLTEEQLARLKHHVKVSCQVFEASVQGMLKGVQKYGPEPGGVDDLEDNSSVNVNAATRHWLPHIFSEAVDAANQTALFADALGVDLV